VRCVVDVRPRCAECGLVLAHKNEPPSIVHSLPKAKEAPLRVALAVHHGKPHDSSRELRVVERDALDEDLLVVIIPRRRWRLQRPMAAIDEQLLAQR
jgi:hypothetical protein